jgi:hypothetical protein
MVCQQPFEAQWLLMYNQFNIHIFYVIPAQCISVLYGSENKQRLFPHIALTDFFYKRFNPLKSSGYYMYRKFNINKFYILYTRCIYGFCVDLRTNSDYIPIQH